MTTKLDLAIKIVYTNHGISHNDMFYVENRKELWQEVAKLKRRHKTDLYTIWFNLINMFKDINLEKQYDKNLFLCETCGYYKTTDGVSQNSNGLMTCYKCQTD